MARAGLEPRTCKLAARELERTDEARGGAQECCSFRRRPCGQHCLRRDQDEGRRQADAAGDFKAIKPRSFAREQLGDYRRTVGAQLDAREEHREVAY